MRRRSQRSSGGRRRRNPPVDREIVNSIKATGSTTTTVATDLIDRRQNMNIVQTPPKQISNQIYWMKELVIATVSTSTSTYVEANVAFSLNQLNDYSNLTSVFDQYCIYSVAVSFSVDGNSPTGVSVSLLTALDYDNIANIGPVGIANYTNCSETLIGPSSSLVRYVKPCIALAAYTGSFGGFATQRCWLNCNSPSIQHYGMRAVYLQTNASFLVRTVYEFVLGFRNKF
jgi:hypothetical protein